MKKGPAINCAHDAMVDVSKLKPHPQNPNKHPKGQVRIYAKIIQHQGWRRPITVSNQSGFIVAGHGALAAAIELGVDKVPVDYQDFKTPADECAHMIADNRLPQMSEMDDAAVAAIVADHNLDAELAGIFDETEPAAPVELKPIAIQPPPKMAWVLIGIPLVKFDKINATIEELAKIPEVVMETTANDNLGI